MDKLLRTGLIMIGLGAVICVLAWFLIPEDIQNGWGPFGTIITVFLVLIIPGIIVALIGLVRALLKLAKRKG